MGKGGGSPQPTQTTAYQTNLPEYAKPYVENMLNSAQKQIYNDDMTSFRPYTPYSKDPTDYFAGPSSLQRSTYGEASQMQTPGQYGIATGMGGLAGLGQMGAGQRFAQQATNPYAVQSYMSPYMQNVVDTEKMAAARDFQIAQPMRQAQQTRQGAFGGSRSAIENAEAQRSLMSRLGEIQAKGTQNAFQNAQQQQQFGANLGLQGLAGASQTAGMLGQLGGAQQQADIARIGLQNQLGGQQQQYQQNIINQQVQDYATQQQYPMLQLANMSNLLRGLPMQAGTTQMYQAAPSVTSQIAGLGTAGIGAYGLGKATGAFKKGGQVQGYKYGGLIPPEKLRGMADSLTKEQLEAQLRDPTLDDIERQIFQTELKEKMGGMGLASLPAGNLDGMGMAGGGIIAFAEGDLVDEEDDSSVGYTDESDDDDMVDALLSRGIAAGAYGNSRGMAGNIDNASIGINPNAPSGEGIRADAKAPRGIEALTAYVLDKESGGRRYDKSGKILTSSKGAEGEMQVMPMTQRDPGYGVKAARDNSPEEKARVGRDYLAALYNKYGDEKLTAIAYNMGPGATDKWLRAGADMNKLPGETKKYVAQLAKGGVIAFKKGGGTDEEDTVYDQITGIPLYGSTTTTKAPATRKAPTQYFMDAPWQRKLAEEKNKAIDTTPATIKPTAEAIAMGPPVSAMRDEAAEQAELDARAAYEAQVAEAGKEKEKSSAGISKLEEMLLKREQGLEKQGAIDASLATILGGLTTASARGKDTAGALKEGAQTGIGYYAGANKQRAAGENAILSGRLGIEKMRGLQDIRQQQMASNLEGKIGSQIGAREKQLEQFATNLITKTGVTVDSAEGQAAIARELQRLKSQDPFLSKLYQQYGLPPIQSAGAPATMSKEQLIAKAKAEKERLGLS